MNGKFAKLFDMPDGNQVLVQKLYDADEDSDAVVISSSLEDCHFQVKQGYHNQEDRDAIFDSFDQAKAETWLQKVVEKMV